MLNTPVATNEYGEAQRRTLYLSTEAFEQDKNLYNIIQSQLVRYGNLVPIKGLAEKTLEHACRIAATLAFAENPKAEVIGADHYRGAIDLMRHYVCEALRLKFRRTPDETKRRADELFNWLKQLYACGQMQIDARTIQRCAPRPTQCRWGKSRRAWEIVIPR
jgi:hypothetical protein